MSFFRRLFLAVLVSLFSTSLWAEGVENSVAGFFVAMPDEEAEYLNMSLKNEMVELYKIGTSGKTRNLLGGESWISYMDSTRIDVTLAAEKCFMTINTYEDRSGRRIYAVVKTLYTPIADSEVVFYDDQMGSLNSDKYFVLPKFKDFFAETDVKSLREVMDRISMMFLKVEVSDEGDFLVTLNDMWLDVMDRDVSAKLLQIKHKMPLRYKWSGKRFKMVES